MRFLVKSLLARRILGTRRTTLVVSSSGNTAYALAQHTVDLDVKLIVVTDVLSPKRHVEALGRFGHVDVVLVDRPDRTGSHLQARLEKIAELKREVPDVIEIDQYGDPRIPLAYEETLAPELVDQTAGGACIIFVAVGTGGLAAGLLDYRDKHGAEWEIVLVDAPGSRLFHEPRGARRRLAGYGNSRQTAFAERCVGRGKVVYACDVDAVRMCRRIRFKYELNLGPSSGAVAAAFNQFLRCPGFPLQHIGIPILICPDGGDHYEETIYNDDWLINNGLGEAITGP